jgi:hypothetical protein
MQRRRIDGLLDPPPTVQDQRQMCLSLPQT